MVRQRRARLLAETRNDVERAVGKAGFRREFGKAQRHQAGLFRRLDDARVADRERRRDGAAEHLAGIVPGDDMRGDALGFPHGRREEAVEEGDRVAVQLVGGAAVIFEIARDGDGVGAGLFHRLAGVPRFQLGDFVRVVFDEAA